MPITLNDVQEYYKMVGTDPNISATRVVTGLLLRALPPQAIEAYDIINDEGSAISADIAFDLGISQTEAARLLKLLHENGLVTKAVDKSKKGKGAMRYIYRTKLEEVAVVGAHKRPQDLPE